jgi:UDPglucose 6-dehydrogenase
MRVAMIGSGYVGLVSGACFADFGHHVTCVDKDADKIARLRKGEMPIFEPDLDRLVMGNIREKRLDFTIGLSRPVAEADAVFIAVGTLPRRGDGHADLSYVHAAAEIAAALAGFTVVNTKFHRAGRHRRRGRTYHPGDPPGRRRRRGVEPRIPARGRWTAPFG